MSNILYYDLILLLTIVAIQSQRDCNEVNECATQSITCSSTTNCVVQCSSTSSCYRSTIYCEAGQTCTISCSGTSNACSESTIYCPDGASCDIDCSQGNSCTQIQVYGGIGGTILIKCRASSACFNMDVDARDASELTIQDCINSNSCLGLSVFCPPNVAPAEPSKKCRIQGNSNMGGDYDNMMRIYAVNGWDDVDISTTSTSRNGNMYCGDTYNAVCSIKDWSISNGDAWECGSSSFQCNTPQPTSNPTVPTTDPSSVPTITPTNNPSVTPTTSIPTIVATLFPTSVPTNIPIDISTLAPSEVPSEIPSDIPSRIPSDIPTDLPNKIESSIPTSRPTHHPTDVECIDKFSGSIVISFQYIETNSNVLIDDQIDNIIQNITDIFIQTEINGKTDCNLTYYESKIGIENNEKAVINISACFECIGTVLKPNNYNITALETDFIEIFNTETNLLTIISNSTLIKVNIRDSDGEAIESTTGIPFNTLGNKIDDNDRGISFGIVMVASITIILLCIICLIIMCMYVSRKERKVKQNEKHSVELSHGISGRRASIVPSTSHRNTTSPIHTGTICDATNTAGGEDIDTGTGNSEEDTNSDVITPGDGPQNINDDINYINGQTADNGNINNYMVNDEFIMEEQEDDDDEYNIKKVKTGTGNTSNNNNNIDAALAMFNVEGGLIYNNNNNNRKQTATGGVSQQNEYYDDIKLADDEIIIQGDSDDDTSNENITDTPTLDDDDDDGNILYIENNTKGEYDKHL